MLDPLHSQPAASARTVNHNENPPRSDGDLEEPATVDVDKVAGVLACQNTSVLLE